SNDPRFEGFIGSKRRRESSKADMINHVLKEIASHPTVGDERKMVVVDDASEMRRDFQQALRRVMERYSDTCQFVLTTRSLTALIPAIQSRCFPVPFRSPSKERVAERLKEIAEAEGVEYDDGGVEYVAEAADGNLREGILLLQTVAVTEGEVRMNTAYDVIEGVGNEDVEEMLEDAYSGDFDSAVERLDDLLIDEGYSGRELLERVLEAAEEHDSERAARLVDTVGEIDARMSEGANPRIHLESLLSSVSE
ncbi:MAG: replication factor C small subunit 2, partial [Halobacteria archaeon]|nr:replication factor C small subunit 2 [Halobacteria archaeon]